MLSMRMNNCWYVLLSSIFCISLSASSQCSTRSSLLEAPDVDFNDTLNGQPHFSLKSHSKSCRALLGLQTVHSLRANRLLG